MCPNPGPQRHTPPPVTSSTLRSRRPRPQDEPVPNTPPAPTLHARDRPPAPLPAAGAAPCCAPRQTPPAGRCCRPPARGPRRRPETWRHRHAGGGTPPSPHPAERAVPHAAARRTSHDRRSARSGRQPGPALLAPGPHDGLAGSGPHAQPKAVPLGSPSVVGLVRTLHLLPPRARGLLARSAGPAAGC